MIVLSYDVDTTDAAGAKRLRKVATLKAQLEKVIDPEKDSVRFYRLGSNWRPRIDYMGRGLRYEQDDTLIL